ncbi:hypothetical protein BGX34_009531 [Mortierella sp. NVP85]|nr:hypothetical protein BGX34_009531 [Mortierella sp. NVP85]
MLNAPAIRLPSVRVQTKPVLQQGQEVRGLNDLLGLLPPKIETPAREVSFVTMPGYSSTINPSAVMSMTDDYLNHHLHATTSIFSPSIPPSQLAWFLIAGSGAHSLPTCAFYFVLYELKPVDILYMKLIHERVNLVPIITKADTLSKNELWVLKKRMIRQLKLNGINFHTFGLDLATIEKMTEQRQWGAAPFTISTRRDRNGNLFESELQPLIQMCLYERFRHSQEHAVHKVVAWRKVFGPSDIPPTTPAQKIWGERSVDEQPTPPPVVEASPTEPEPVPVPVPEEGSPRQVETQLMNQYLAQGDAEFTPPPPQTEVMDPVDVTPAAPAPIPEPEPTAATPEAATPAPTLASTLAASTSQAGYTSGFVVVPTVVYTGSSSPFAISGTDTSGVMSPPPPTLPNAPTAYVPTTSYSPRPKAATTNAAAAQARMNLIQQSASTTVDNSSRPNEIIEDNGGHIRTSFMGAYFSSPEIGDITLGSPDFSATSTDQGSEFKVEVPNSGTSYQLTSESPLDSALQQQLQYQQLLQQKHDSFILPNGYPSQGPYFVPSTSDLYQTALMTASAGAATEGSGEILPDIWEAVELGDLAAVQRHLINGASPDQRNSSRSTLLHRTAWQGSKPYAVMHLLISYGANVNLTNENGNTVLQNVLMKHDDPALIKLLLDNGAETTIPNKEGMNTLEVAALFNKLESAKYLLENDLSSSEPESIMNALQRARSPDKKAMKLQLKGWQGKEGERKRAELLERARASGLHTQHSSQSQAQLHERGMSQHQNTSSSQIQDATSVHSAHSFDTTRDGHTGSIGVEQQSQGPMSPTTGNQGKHLSRFNLKTMRVAAPSVSNLFSRKQ